MNLIAILFALQLTYSLGSGLECTGPHEQLWNNTWVCPLQCNNLHFMRCMSIIEGKPSCQCKDGTVWDPKKDKCVYLTECSEYNRAQPIDCNAENEVFAESVSACPATCAHSGGPLCAVLIHKPSCVCAEGTVRDTVNNRCVKVEECPKKEPTPIPYEIQEQLECNGPNEEYKEWVSACPEECYKYGIPPPTTEKPLFDKCLALVHKPSCVCTNGTIRDTIKNKCVTRDQCTPVPYETKALLECKGPNEEYKEWVSPCQEACLAGTTPPTTEKSDIDRCLTLEHNPSCVCTNGTIRDRVFKRCVHRDQCPQIPFETNEQLECNGENEMFAEVVSACPPTCAHPVGPLCAALIHKPSCVCNKGWVRNTDTNKCVKIEECLKKETPAVPYEMTEQLECKGPNEIYEEWINPCQEVCIAGTVPPPTEKPEIDICKTLVHKPSCICTNGTIRDAVFKRCVPRDQCPPIPLETKQQLECNGLNEQYSEWVSACPDECPKIGIQPPTDTPVLYKCLAIVHKPSCVCMNGTIRDTLQNKCVTRDQCTPIPVETKQQLQCNGQNEVYAEVVSACPPTCAHPVGPLCNAMINKPSCVCAEGTVRETASNRCVKREECFIKEMPFISEIKEQIECKGENEAYSEWVVGCPEECNKYGTRPPTTEKPAVDICKTIQHKPSCVCTNGTIRDTLNNRCVTRDQCPLIPYETTEQLVCNGPNEKYEEWVTPCPDECPKYGFRTSTTEKPAIDKCLALVHQPSCVCTNGTIRDTHGNRCVTRDNCPLIPFETEQQLECNGQNEVFAESVSACPPTCAHPVGPLCMAIIHKPSCVCAVGTVRDTVNKKCVKREECLKNETPVKSYEFVEQLKCDGPNEEYSEWVSACPHECNRLGKFVTTTQEPVLDKCMGILQKPSCICTNGTIRDTLNNICVTPDKCPIID